MNEVVSRRCRMIDSSYTSSLSTDTGIKAARCIPERTWLSQTVGIVAQIFGAKCYLILGPDRGVQDLLDLWPGSGESSLLDM